MANLLNCLGGESPATLYLIFMFLILSQQCKVYVGAYLPFIMDTLASMDVSIVIEYHSLLSNMATEPVETS